MSAEDLKEGSKKKVISSPPKPPEENTMKSKASPKRYMKPAYLNTMSEVEREANLKVLENMNKRLNYLKNPRYKVEKPIILMSSANFGEIASKQNPFSVIPEVLQFQDCRENQVYELPLKLTNKSAVSRRVSEYFGLGTVKYPSNESGLIAPGMSVMLNIRFAAPGLGDLDDELVIINEEDSFKVPIIARRTPPDIRMESPITATPCWLGVRTEKVVKCTNLGGTITYNLLGESGFNLLPGKGDTEVKQDSPEFLRIGPFSIYPPQFYLPKGESINLIVLYSPDSPGEHVEDLILETAFQTRSSYQLKGTGCVLDVEASALDSMILNYKENPLSVIYFKVTKPKSIATRKLKVRNNCQMKVQYHWSIYKNKFVEKISLAGEETHYTIEPLQGVFNGGEEQEFTISFKPLHAESYFEYADLIVDDIPIQAVQDAPETLKTLLSPGVGPTYLGSNTRYPSFPYLKFTLQGYGGFCEIVPDPPVLMFPGDMLIQKAYSTKIKLINKSKSEAKTKIMLKGKTSEALDVVIGSSKINPVNAEKTIYQGIITDNIEELDVTVQSKIIGNHRAYFVGEIEDGNPFSFEVFGHFTGPRIRIIEKTVDFGLVRTKNNYEYRLNLENLTDIEAEVIVKNVKNKALTFATLNFEKNAEPKSSEGKRVKSAANAMSKVESGASITVEPEYRKLGPLEKISILISLHTAGPETIEEEFEIVTKSHGSQYISLHAEVQKPHLSLSRTSINLGDTYAGLQYKVDGKNRQAVYLKNFGNLDAQFHWEDKMIADEIEVSFEPARGVVKAKSEQLTVISFTFYKGGKIEELFACDIEDMDAPLGFMLQTVVFGLSVNYELYDEAALLARTEQKTSSNFVKTTTELSALLPPARYDNNPMNATKRSRHADAEAKDLNLKELDFSHCMINKVSVRKFVMKNNSGIRAPYVLHSNSYEPLRYMDQIIPQAIQVQALGTSRAPSSKQSLIERNEKSNKLHDIVGEMSKSSKTVKFAVSTRSKSTVKGKKKIYALNHPLLTEAHEQDKKFESAIGETYTATRKVEQEQNFYLENNKGIAVVCQPHKGELAPHSEVIITATIYNNVCGKYEDQIISEVKGLPPFNIPVTIGVKGSPIIIPSNQVGVYFDEDPPALVMRPTVLNGGTVSKSFKIKNTGIQDVEIDWKIYDLQELTNKPDADMFSIFLAKNEGNATDPYRIELDAIEPEQESTNSPFKVTPKRSVVSSKEKYTYEVSFDTSRFLGTYNSVLLAHPRIAKEESKEGYSPNLGIICLSLHGETVKAHLTVDKKQRMDGNSYIQLDVWPYNMEGAPPLTKKISLTNESPADTVFNIDTTGPFEIVNSATNAPPHPLSKPATSTVKKPQIVKLFDLLPGTFLDVTCKTLRPDPSNIESWPPTLRTVKTGTLNITYSNGSLEQVILEANLLRPYITIHVKGSSKNELAEEEFDFGTVYIGIETKDIVMYLKNETKVTAKWSLNYVKIIPKAHLGHKTITKLEKENIDKTDDQSAFAFSANGGIICGPSTEITWMPQGESIPHVEKDEFNSHLLPHEVFIKFIPKKATLYKSKFRILVDQGISSEIILKGTGAIKDIED